MISRSIANLATMSWNNRIEQQDYFSCKNLFCKVKEITRASQLIVTTRSLIIADESDRGFSKTEELKREKQEWVLNSYT
jgi:hypothetical protein